MCRSGTLVMVYEATEIMRPLGGSVQSDKSELTPTGDTAILRDRQSRKQDERKIRKSGVMEVKGTGVSRKRVSDTVDKWPNTRTEKNLLDLETSAKQKPICRQWRDGRKMRKLRH